MCTSAAFYFLAALVKRKWSIWKYFGLSSDTDHDAQHFVYYNVQCQICSSRAHKGWRAEMYVLAAKSFGHYKVDKGHSIYYDDGDNLVLDILFGSEQNAHSFMNSLAELRMKFFLTNDIVMDRQAKRVTFASAQPIILATDYDSADYESSPHHSLCLSDYSPHPGLSDSASVCSLSDPTAHLLMLENPSLPHVTKLELYDCHLMSQAEHKKEKKNPNNILKLSWPLHQRFDGLHAFGQHRVPQIAVAFVEFVGREIINLAGGYEESRDKVKISIESPDLDILNSVGSTLKSGSVYCQSDNKWYSYVHVMSHEDFERCLTFKFNETKELWANHQIGDLLPS